jgi:flagellar basal-body rod protein FlgC
MFSSLDISTSALVAQRARMNTISSNLANLSTTHNEAGEAEPYQPRYVVFQAVASGAEGAEGVRVSEVQIDRSAEPRWKYEPGHPDAMKDGPHKGYVAYPGVDMMTEMTNAMEAARAYEANLGAMTITKDMHQQSLRIIA